MEGEFKEFAFKGNVLSLAIGHVGGAFGKNVTSGRERPVHAAVERTHRQPGFSKLFIAMDGKTYDSVAKAQEADIATFNYGAFITGGYRFLLIAACIFLFVKLINRLRRSKKEETRARRRTAQMPLLLQRDSKRGHALPTLHFNTDGGK